MTGGRILVFANGVVPDLEAARRLLLPDDFVICADGGARHVRALGIIPDMLVGDLDSLGAVDLAQLQGPAVDIRKHPRDKDESDLELALGLALARDPASIVIVGGLGARLDHTLGNLALLLDPGLIGRACSIDDGLERVVLCRDRVEIRGEPEDLVSLIPWGAPVTGVRTQGLKWLLAGDTLFPQRSRGISNELLERAADVQIEGGLLLVIHRRRPAQTA